jgi:hypothetical protein
MYLYFLIVKGGTRKIAHLATCIKFQLQLEMVQGQNLLFFLYNEFLCSLLQLHSKFAIQLTRRRGKFVKGGGAAKFAEHLRASPFNK